MIWRGFLSGFLVFGALASGSAQAQSTIDFSGVHDGLAGEPTRVLVLGTPHLTDVETKVAPGDLDLLVDRLAAYAPDLIAIEAVPGQTCDLLRHFASVYPGIADTYCENPDPALTALGMTGPEASLALAEALDGLSEAPGPADRRRLAALFWATGEPWSAALQWLHLPEAERMSGDGVSEALALELEDKLTSRNENRAIAARLAVQLGHNRLHPIDDHSADSVLIFSREELGPTLQTIWQRDIAGEGQLEASAEALLGSPEGLLSHYRAINAPEYQAMVVSSDAGAAAATPDHDLVARHYVAWWQVRGLRMAANLVAAAGNSPGARVLAIVGASHKPYFDAYLDQMLDIELVDPATVLTP
jgi:hypothetical protein